jgi:hypothetical protein
MNTRLRAFARWRCAAHCAAPEKYLFSAAASRAGRMLAMTGSPLLSWPENCMN